MRFLVIIQFRLSGEQFGADVTMKLLRSVFLFVPIEDGLLGVAFVATRKITFEFLLLVFLSIVTLESLL